MPRPIPLIALVSTAILFVGTSAGADQLLFGKKLLVKNPTSGPARNKVVHLGKDVGITVVPAGSAGDPQCSGVGGGGASSLRLVASGGAGDVTIPLPCAGWTTNGPNTLYKYRDPTGATCTVVLVKDGVLAKAVCTGTQVAISLNGGMAPVAVVLTLNTELYCTEFGGTVVKDGSDAKTFQSKNALAPASCPTTTTTSTSSSTSTSTSTSTSSSSTSSSSTSTSTSSTTTSTVSHCGTYFGAGALNVPEGIGVDASGFVYVADSSNNRVQKFDGTTGMSVTTWGVFGTGDGEFNHPVGIAVDGLGYVYVGDGNNNRIQKFTDTGTFVAKWGSTGSGDGQLTNPAGMASDGLGNIYVAEEGSNNRVQEFTDVGAFVTKWGGAGSGDGQFFRPHSVAVDGSGDVYVVDANNSRIQKFTAAGGFILKWGSGGSGPGQFSDPSFVGIDGGGTVFVSEWAGQRLQSFTGVGGFLSTWNVGGFWRPTGVAPDGSGNLFVSDNGNNLVWKFACP